MDLGLLDKRALVVGSSKGLGKATALALLAEGSQVTAAARSVEQIETPHSRSVTTSPYVTGRRPASRARRSGSAAKATGRPAAATRQLDGASEAGDSC